MAKKKRQDKKGLELSINVIIILVIVVIALIAVVAFFGGSFGNLATGIGDIFRGSQAGVPQALALQNCERACDIIEGSTSDVAVEISGYCTNSEDVDTDGDGEADTIFYCNDEAEQKFGGDALERSDLEFTASFGLTCGEITCPTN